MIEEVTKEIVIHSIDWFSLIQTLAIIASLAIATYSIYQNNKTQKISNYLTLIQYHREIWKMTFDNKSLSDIFKIKNKNQELTLEQNQFLTFLFLHLSCSYELYKNNNIIKIEGIGKDISSTFAFPAIKEFWDKNLIFYNNDFVEFVNKYTKSGK